MPDSVLDFYNSLTDVYHLIFEDWDRAMARQARAIDAILKRKLGIRPLRILDCACGIGTQTLGLAELGHELTASDLSSAAIARARVEAGKRGVDTSIFHVADMVSLEGLPSAQFDVVAAFDNALSHLSGKQLLEAAASFRRVVKPGGIFMGSLRDYDTLIDEQPTSQGPSFFGEPGTKRIVHQVWDWTARDRYDVHLYITLQEGEQWKSLHFVSEYRCLLRAEVDRALGAAGFGGIEWLMPEVTGFYQPIVIATALHAAGRGHFGYPR